MMTCIAAAAAWLGPAGCVSRHLPDVGYGRYAGPPIRVDSTGATHVLVLTAPSGGYTLTVDRVLERSKCFDVFATVRTPDPRFLYTQSVVELRAAVALPAFEKIRVLARILPAGSTDDPDYPPVEPAP